MPAKAKIKNNSEERGPLLSLAESPVMQRWAPPLAIVLLALLFLFPMLRGVYIWDDDQWLTNNPVFHMPDGLWRIWTSTTPQFYPLVFTTFWIEHSLWQFGTVGADGVLRGVGYHVDNLLLHIGAALIIFYLLKGLKLGGGTLGAWLAATIFAIHPVNVESVAWVAERKNVLCGVFFFASLLLSFKFFRVIDPPAEKAGGGAFNRKQYAGAMGLFLAAMLSKTIACMLPPVILLMIWWKRGRISAREVLLSSPFFLIAGGLGFVTIATEHSSVGTTGPDWIFSPLGRMLAAHPEKITASLKWEAMGQELVARTLIAGQAVWFYIEKIVWPYPVVQIYPRFSFDIFKPALYAAPGTILMLVAALYLLRKKITRGPVTAVICFVIVLFPALCYINFYTMLYTFVADHYQYLACIAIIVLGVEGLLWILRVAGACVPTDLSDKKEGAARFYRLTAGLVSGGIILSFGMLAHSVSGLYTDAEVLWKFNTDINPAAFAAWNNLATAIFNRGIPDLARDRADAISVLQHSIAAGPQDWRAYHTLGMVYLDMNDTDAAAKYLREAEALMPPFVRNGRADFLQDQVRRGTLAGAGLNGLNAVTSDAAYSPSYLLARNFEDHEQWDRAIAGFTDDIQHNPGNAEAYLHLGNCYVGKGDYLTAITWYGKAIEKHPAYAEAYFNRGICRRFIHQDQQGTADLFKAREIDPTVIGHVPSLLREAATQMRNR